MKEKRRETSKCVLVWKIVKDAGRDIESGGSEGVVWDGKRKCGKHTEFAGQ